MNEKNVSDTVVKELAELYAQVDAQIQSESVCCRQCGKCCDFRTNGFRLYTLELERILILQKTGSGLELIDGKCSALRDGKCSIHPVRPLGCRTQFCEACFDDLYEQTKEKIQHIEKRASISYDYTDTFQKQRRVK